MIIVLLVSQNIPTTPGGQIQIDSSFLSKEHVPPFWHIYLPSGEHLPTILILCLFLIYQGELRFLSGFRKNSIDGTFKLTILASLSFIFFQTITAQFPFWMNNTCRIIFTNRISIWTASTWSEKIIWDKTQHEIC